MGDGDPVGFQPDNQRRSRQIIAKQDYRQFFDNLRDHLRGHKPIFQSDIRTACPASPGRWLRMRGLALRDSTGHAYRMAGFITDVTEEKHNEQALRLAKEEAEVANRTKTEFFANMSHELRTPLNAVIGFSEIIRDHTFGPIGVPEYEEYIQDILGSGQHLLSVINDILDLSKAEAGKLELEETVFSILPTFKSCLRLVSERASKQGVKISVEADEALLSLRGDERKFKQMILNLLSNSIKFTPSGGVIALRASNQNGRIVVAAEDSGIGMSEDGIERAMDPFGQVDSAMSRNHEGSGLGLPIVHSLVKLHGAAFDLKSRPFEGTTVSITFPEERCLPAVMTALR